MNLLAEDTNQAVNRLFARAGLSRAGVIVFCSSRAGWLYVGLVANKTVESKNEAPRASSQQGA